jgi:hypothetical protein
MVGQVDTRVTGDGSDEDVTRCGGAVETTVRAHYEQLGSIGRPRRVIAAGYRDDMGPVGVGKDEVRAKGRLPAFGGADGAFARLNADQRDLFGRRIGERHGANP